MGITAPSDPELSFLKCQKPPETAGGFKASRDANGSREDAWVSLGLGHDGDRSMSEPKSTASLEITVARLGFYKGFNPVVAISAKGMVLFLALSFAVTPVIAQRVLDAATGMAFSAFGGWYIYLMASGVVFLLTLAILPVSGRVRLGPDDARPEFGTAGWLSMMFCAGIGIGILVFSVNEPISHFISNPDIITGTETARSARAAVSAMGYVFLHWGFSVWCCFALVGLALGLACHRDGHPLTMRSALAALFGRRLEGVTGHAVDVISIIAIVAGITTALALGLEQIVSGLALLTGRAFFAEFAGSPPITALLSALVVALAAALASILSGVERGVKWTSQIGILLSFCLMLIFVLHGAGVRVIGLFAESGLSYLRNLPSRILTVQALAPGPTGEAARIWQEQWTIFYWAWCIAIAPFVGLFLARVSRGRTVREFILGAVLAPSLMCFAWFAAIGGSALLLELDGTAQGRLIAADHAQRIYVALGLMLTPGLAFAAKLLVLVLFLALIVASATAAIIAIRAIGAGGGEDAESPLHSMVWALLIAMLTGVILSVGGAGSIRDVMILGAAPFSAIMALMIPAIALAIFHAGIDRRPLAGPEPVPPGPRAQ